MMLFHYIGRALTVWTVSSREFSSKLSNFRLTDDVGGGLSSRLTCITFEWYFSIILDVHLLSGLFLFGSYRQNFQTFV